MSEEKQKDLKKKEKDKRKTLILVRHAKSSWDDNSLPDFDRPLNDRGKGDAPVMARKLRDQKVKIDAFFSSPAQRAKKTASIFAKEYDTNKKDINLVPELYEAEVQDFYEVIGKVDRDYQNIAVFSHNPGITDFANSLTETRIDNIPTCGIFAIRVDSKKWSDFKDSKKEFWFFDSPKNGD